MYRVKLTIAPGETNHPAQQVLRGSVVIAGKREAPGLRFVRKFLSVLWRELGF